MKRIISSLGVALACLSFANTTSAQQGFEYSTAAAPKWYVIKSAMKTDAGEAGYATDKVFVVNGMEKSVNFADFDGSSYQQFRFEKIAGTANPDSFKIINKKFPDGCLLSKGGLRSADRTYGALQDGYVAWSTSSLGEGQFLILAEDGLSDKGDEGTAEPTPTPVRLHAQNTGSVIVSWPFGEANSASAWTFEPVVEELTDVHVNGFNALIGSLEKYNNVIVGDGVGEYPEAEINLIWAFLDELYLIPSFLELPYAEAIGILDQGKEAIARIEASKGVHNAILPEPSTAENPIWYVWTSEAPDGDVRKGRFLSKHSDLVVRSDGGFESTNLGLQWRVEKKENKYAIINRAGGYLHPSLKENAFVIDERTDTSFFSFTIRHQEETNPSIPANILVVISENGSPVHLQNHDPYGTMTYGAGDPGSRFSFQLASNLISTPVEYSTDENEVWYYIKNKRQADKEVNSKGYLTAYDAVKDSLYVRVNSTTGEESKFIYQTFGRPESMVVAAGDSAKWKFVKTEIDEIVEGGLGETKRVEKTMIINKFTGKCLNAQNFANGHPVRFVDATSTADTVFPYWDIVDQTKEKWAFRSKQIVEDESTAAFVAKVTYANFDNGPGLVLYSTSSDAGNFYWLEKVTDFVSSTPERPAGEDIKIFVNDGKIVVSGTDATPDVFTITGATIDADQKLSQGVYVVKVGGKSAKVVVTK